MGRKARILEQKCSKCKQIKPRAEFGTRKGGALDTYCCKCRGVHKVKPKPRKVKKEDGFKTYGLSPYQLLAARVIETAVEDLKYLKAHNLEHSTIAGVGVSRSGLTRFFLGEYRYLTSVDAEYILRKVD